MQQIPSVVYAPFVFALALGLAAPLAAAVQGQPELLQTQNPPSSERGRQPTPGSGAVRRDNDAPRQAPQQQQPGANFQDQIRVPGERLPQLPKGSANLPSENDRLPQG